MWEDPGVEIRRVLPLVEDVAALRIELARAIGRRFDDLMIGEDARHLGRDRHLLLGDLALRSVGTDHQPRPDARFGAVLPGIDDDRRPVRLVLDPLEAARRAPRPMPRRALAQEFVEMLPVHHADEAAIDRHVHLARGGRDHPRRIHPRHDDAVGDVEVAHQPRRDGAPAGLDPPGLVEQQHAPPGPRQVVRRRRPGGPAADHDDIEASRLMGHGFSPPCYPLRDTARPPRRSPGAAARPILAASTPDARNSAPSAQNTAP
jgi:hypothetical protein